MSFRRERYIPKGGPDGGDGGDGGGVMIFGDPSLNTLLHLKYHSTWMAGRGGHGKGNRKRGANAANVMIPVPIGTVVKRVRDGDTELIADITASEPIVVASGGTGGWGNARFVSSVQQEPVLVETGGVGERVTLLLELKLLADAALIGLPNAGKSTLLAQCSRARPKIAPYPFTTTEPVLGVVETRGESFVMMEVPGLIEGAHSGRGLGHEFLRHIERARVLVHVVDGTSDDPWRDWDLVNQELASFDPALISKPQIIAVNKVDIPEVKERISAAEIAFAGTGKPVLFVSGATGEGVDALLGKTLELLSSGPPSHPLNQPARPSPVVKPRRRDRTFKITREDDVYVVDVPAMERLVPLADLHDQRAILQIWKELQRLGVAKALEEAGLQPGDTVRLGGVDLEWY